jgi:hypothetical protein
MDAFFALKTGPDRYVVNGASSNDFRASAQRDGAILFQMPSASETSDGLVLLQTLGGRTHVAADPSLGVILQDRSAPHVPFLKVAAFDGFALGTPDKEHWLSVSDDGKLVFSKLASPGVSETFTAQTPPQHHGHGCCGPSSAGAVKTLWNDETHKTIVMKAIECLRTSPSQTLRSHEFITCWDNTARGNPDGQAALFSGLLEADYTDFLNDKSGAITYYTSHFYDPDTGKNYWEDDSPTALERGQDYFNASLNVLNTPDYAVELDLGRWAWRSERMRVSFSFTNINGRWQVALRLLGIALHYLTDLTQPMHAANIANIYGGRGNPLLNEWRHSNYEDYAERVTRSGHLFDNYPPLTAEQMDLQYINGIGEYYLKVAKESKKIWLKDVKPLFDKKPYNSQWGDEAKPAVYHSTQQAPAHVAKVLLYWIHWAESRYP